MALTGLVTLLLSLLRWRGGNVCEQCRLVPWHSLSWCDGVESMLWWHGLQRRDLFCAGSSVKLEQFVVYTLKTLRM